jgi:hypothetical protein
MARALHLDPAMQRWGAAAIAFAIASGAASARADTAPVTGVVVAADGGDLILDIGGSKGAKDDDVVEIWRPIQVRHPVTHQLISDRFLIGHLKLSQVRPALSLAAPEGTLSRAPKVGDVVVLHPAPPPPTPTPTVTPTPTRTPTPTPTPAPTYTPTPAPDRDAAELSALFYSLHGASPETRADRYERFARSHSESRFARSLLEEAQALRVSAALERPPQTPDPVVSFRAPERAYAGRALRLGVELRHGCKGAVLYVTTADKTTFTAIPMAPDGGDYFAATIPKEEVRKDLRVFVEGIDQDGKAHPSDASHRIEVIVRPDVVLVPKVLAQAGVWSDFATYNTRAFNDWTFQTEGYFGARFRDTGLRAVRSGFGVYRGVGGSLHDLDDLGLAGRDVGLTYGYLEAEAAFSHIVSLIGRAVVGLDQDGVEPGAQAFIRFGNDLGTNLLLGGEVLGGVGVRGIAELDWNAGPRFPIMFRSEVTNQPAGSAHPESGGVSGSQGDVGVRLIVQGGYRITPAFAVALRASYQGRTIYHAGPGGGAAVTYQW